MSGQKEERQRQHQIDRQELHALEPVRPAVARDLTGDEDREKNGEDQAGGKARSIGVGPTTRLASTRTGATKSATCTLEPIAIESDRSMRFFIAAATAFACSAALPRIATRKTPTKILLRPPTYCRIIYPC
jgi:hypothetical protein